jgi:hypothetical protein
VSLRCETDEFLGAAPAGRRRHRTYSPAEGKIVEFILWIIAVILVVSGIVALFRGEMLWGVVLIIVGLLVGPGGVSIFT